MKLTERPTPLTDEEEEAADRFDGSVASCFARDLEQRLGAAVEDMQWLCDRVERGEIRSKKTYARFRETLAAIKEAE